MERYQQLLKLHKESISQRAIAKRLGINRETVGRYVRAGQFPERAPRKYASTTDPFTDYLRKRWEEGCHNAAQLARELKGQGFTCSYHSARRRVAHWDRAGNGGSANGSTLKAPVMHPPSARRLGWPLLKEPGDLDEQDRTFLEALSQRCPEVTAAGVMARDFAMMMREHQGDAGAMNRL